MQFRLMFEGAVPPSQEAKSDKDKPKLSNNKTIIRTQFHEQLKTLWNNHPTMKEARACKNCKLGHSFTDPVQQSHSLISLQDHYTEQEEFNRKYNNKNLRICPIATEKIGLRCEVDILFLVPDINFSAYSAGDLDNRVKTLIDALTPPSKQSNLDSFNEEILYCVMEDDKLITSVNASVDFLLKPKHPQKSKLDCNFAMITVKLKPTKLTPFTAVFL